MGDADAAAEAYRLLAPFADLPVMASLAVACFGSAHRPLGIAARTMGDLDRAVGHLEAASTADLALGHRPCHAIDLALLADLLEQRAGASDAERAAALRQAAIDEGRRSSLTARPPVGAAGCGAERHSRSPLPQGRTILAGQRGSAGRRSSPTPWDSATSASSSSGPGLPSPRSRLASEHALACRGMPEVPVLDAPAKAAYRARIEELQREIDDADAAADIERAARGSSWIGSCTSWQSPPVLADEPDLRRRRRAARVSVHKAIKRALAAIADVDPVLGDELGRRVVTGMRCMFALPAG